MEPVIKKLIPKKLTVNQIVLTALLVAMEVVMSRLLSIPTPILKISLSFLPIVVIAILYGPIYAGIGAALADFIGAMLFPVGAFFPGFTISAFLIGCTYGIFLYKGNFEGFKGLVKVIAAAFIVTFVLQLGLETLWIAIIMVTNADSDHTVLQNAYMAFLPVRAVRSAIMLPIQVVLIRLLPLLTRHMNI
ncbi:MAG: folate family ECF transporter S component [Oscillospiraceae bacterium]|nr:folate family ECF transporter S component [Oscillospiraceae bacterium]